MVQLKELTQKYGDVFGRRDLNAVAALLHPETALHDPNAGWLRGKDEVLKFVDGLFNALPNMRWTTEHILVAGDAASVMEFTLHTGEKELKGCDVILWDGGLIKEIRAYVYG